MPVRVTALLPSATAEQKTEKTRTADFGLPTHRRDGGSRGSQDSCVVNAETQN